MQALHQKFSCTQTSGSLLRQLHIYNFENYKYIYSCPFSHMTFFDNILVQFFCIGWEKLYSLLGNVMYHYIKNVFNIPLGSSYCLLQWKQSVHTLQYLHSSAVSHLPVAFHSSAQLLLILVLVHLHSPVSQHEDTHRLFSFIEFLWLKFPLPPKTCAVMLPLWTPLDCIFSTTSE